MEIIKASIQRTGSENKFTFSHDLAHIRNFHSLCQHGFFYVVNILANEIKSISVWSLIIHSSIISLLCTGRNKIQYLFLLLFQKKEEGMRIEKLCQWHFAKLLFGTTSIVNEKSDDDDDN